MTGAVEAFDNQFAALLGFPPFRWQQRLFQRLVKGEVPAALDLPTGLGKTSVMAIWLLARAHGAKLPRRLVYVVDRRAVVDQATTEAEKLRVALDGNPALESMKARLGLDACHRLPISTLRGQFIDNREWLDDPSVPAIIVGTIDMIGSRLLFEGYGVTRKMRPYHAGLLGVDALIVLDEAHLVPPFAHLLHAIEHDTSLRPKEEADRKLLPGFVFLPLSATQRDLGAGERGRVPFRLEDEDWKADRGAEKRLKARKRLRLEPLAEKDPDKQLAEAAWALATKDGKFLRIAVFCDRRDNDNKNGGPSVQGVKKAIEKLAEGDRKAGRAKVEIHPIELLVGARRVHERETAAKRLRELNFIGEKKPLEKPAFLVATAAGEVGVDIDADHMILDLVAWERMVQRFGRVNRRGEGDAEVTVFWSEPSVKDARAPTETEKRALIAFQSKTIIEGLPQIDGAYDASPGALRDLSERAQTDAALKAQIEAATTPEPLRPALNRALVDAWSMTSLDTHTGRPEVAPWLRGWVEDAPQTTIVWRAHLPIRTGTDGHPIPPDKAEIEDFFEAAPPQGSEKLDTETYRVVSWLQARAHALLSRKRRSSEKGIEDEASTSDDTDTEEPDEQTARQARRWERHDIAVLVLSLRGDYAGYYALRDLAQERKGRAKDDFQNELIGKTLVVDAGFGGLRDGLLDEDSNDPVETADNAETWSQKVPFRVRSVADPYTPPPAEWRFEYGFDLLLTDEGESVKKLIVEHYKDAAQTEDARSISKPQELAEHQDWVRSEALRIAKAANLSSAAANALAVAAGLHDEGKKAECWQRAFKAPRDANEFGLTGPLAKTLGPVNQAILGGYRHEFGSLRHVEENAEFQALPEDWQDLALHLVAAHHGKARPVIETRGCEDGPPSSLEERARAVALRFARLQRRWGPWGLAWWEALLRAADARASRANEERPVPTAEDGVR